MGQLILCGGRAATSPYHIKSGSVNIYSLEEMSYYLIHGMDDMDADFMCQDFCNWVKRETGQEEIAKKLADCLEQQSSLSDFAGILLTETGYATREEIRETLELLRQFEAKDELERRKIRADRLLRKHRYGAAVGEYVWILQHRKEEMKDVFLGNVLHNLGVAHAGVFLYGQAAEYFHEAYQKNHSMESLKEELVSMLLEGRQEDAKARATECGIREEVYDGLASELGRMEDRIERCASCAQIERLFESFGNGTARQELSEKVEQWKQEYRGPGRS